MKPFFEELLIFVVVMILLAIAFIVPFGAEIDSLLFVGYIVFLLARKNIVKHINDQRSRRNR